MINYPPSVIKEKFVPLREWIVAHSDKISEDMGKELFDIVGEISQKTIQQCFEDCKKLLEKKAA